MRTFAVACAVVVAGCGGSQPPRDCRDAPRTLALTPPAGYTTLLEMTCSWDATRLTWSCSGGAFGANFGVSHALTARYASEADFVAERTLGVLRAVESSYTAASSKAGYQSRGRSA